MKEAQKPYEIEGKCGGCGAEFSGRVTDAALESYGMRKIDGVWHCNLCTGAGFGGMKRRESGEEAQDDGG